jgi:hypothetical protein
MTGYRVWFVENPPNRSKYFDVDSPIEGKKLLDKISEESKAPCNAGGLQEFDGDEWVEWYDANGDNVDESLFEEE